MTGLEITLLLVGIVFMVGSFLITERLSGSELNKVSELSEDEIRRILERELTSAQQKIDTQIEQSIVNSIEQSSDCVDRALDKETNEKIMAISEFSDTVMENMNKTHNEIMFLYSMLNDKHATMTEHMEEVQKLLSEIDQKKETQDTDLAAALAKFEEHIKEREEELSQEMEAKTADFIEAVNAFLAEKAAEQEAEQQLPEVEEISEEQTEEVPEEEAEPEVEEKEETVQQESNHNAAILELHRQGAPEIEIAKELGLGVGEVKLVLGLFREEEA